ncbi:MAG: YbbR-like domain-containing protein [Lachnospiraceae bacterium]
MNKNIKDRIFKNIGWKLLSIGLAVLFWCLIMNMSDPRITITIKNISVNKTNEQAVVDEDMIYDVVSGDTISISVTGPRSVVQSLSETDVYAYVNLKELSITNACPIHVTFKNSQVGKNVEITSKSDEVMILSLEEMVVENKKIFVEMKGNPADNYYADASVSPLMLEVYGSATQVSNIEKLVATVDIEGKNSSFSTNVKVVPYDKEGNVIDVSKLTIQENRVDVTVDLYPTKNINLVIDDNVTAEYGFACKPLEQAPGSITIAGPVYVLKEITEIVIPFERTGLKETLAENISLTEYIPEGCFLVSDTDTVSVTVPVVMLNENRVMSVKIADITAKNLNTSLEIKNNTTLTSFSVWGAEGTTEQITLDDLGLYIDCTSVTGPGTYELSLQYDAGEEILLDKTTVSITVGEKK